MLAVTVDGLPHFCIIATCRKNVVEKVLRLLKRKERWLVVAGVRFLRTCIGTKDDFYMRHLTKNNLLDPVMHVFFENGERYNLLNSVVLELVDFIRRENIKVRRAASGGSWCGSSGYGPAHHWTCGTLSCFALGN